MSFHEPTDPPGTSLRDGPAPARTSPPADDATHSGDSNPDGATLDPSDPIREAVATRSLHDASTIGYVLAEPSPATATPPVPGYDLLALLGEGGMGAVWKARQTNLNRLVALKMVLGDQRAGSKELIRFLAEAEAVAAVRHPHVVQVYEYGEANGRPFLALEYLPGGSLADRLKRDGRLDPKAAAELVGMTAGAVQAAHDLGIVHRDLKPGNVLFDDRGTPKVTDFGLAKRAGGGDLTSTQAVLGTPAYMAPEQARGETKFVGPRADIYSLGVILYECLTGAKPFLAPDQLALLRRVVEEEPERPGRRAPGVPRDVELICLKCLAKDPDERYQTARALAADLGRFAAGEPVSVRAAGVVERVARWARRKPTLATAYSLGFLAVLLGGLGGAAVWQRRAAERARGEAEWAQAEAERLREQADTARREAEQARGREAEARVDAERQREKAERYDYGRTIQVAHQECREGNGSAALEVLNSTRADLRGWEWYYVNSLAGLIVSRQVLGREAVQGDEDGVHVLAPEEHTAGVHSATFSSDGSRFITASSDGKVMVWSAKPIDAAAALEMGPLTGHTAAVYAATFSPDGSRALTGSQDGTARVWDMKVGADALVLKGHTAGVHSATFSRDGSRVVTASYDGTARVWDAVTGAEILALKLKRSTAAVLSATFSPDGLRILTGSSDGRATVWDAKTRAEVLALKGHTAAVYAATFSPDGSRALTGSQDGTARVWDARTGAQVLVWKGHTAAVHSATFSRDGSRVVTASYDGTARVWDAVTGAEILALKLKRSTAAVLSATFSPDGLRILTGSSDGRATVWDAKTGAEILGLRELTVGIVSATQSLDGSRVVTGSQDGTARVWGVRARRQGLRAEGAHRSRVLRNVQPGRLAGRHRESRRDGAGLGRQDRRPDPGAGGRRPRP